MSEKTLFEVVGFDVGSPVILVDDDTQTRSLLGTVIRIEWCTITVLVNGCEVKIEGKKFQGKTPFGSCTMVKG